MLKSFLLIRFDSMLVRLKASDKSNTLASDVVSIPYWFD